MTRDRDDDQLHLNALADDELDAATALALERRLETEPSLAAEYERVLAVKAAMRRLERPSLSDAFAARIAALADAPPAAVNGVPLGGRTPHAAWSADWRAMAASLALVAGLSSVLTFSLMSNDASQAIEDGIVSGHRRSLLATSAIDVASSDRHTVRPWFDAKLGVAPPTPDLSAKGFFLVGGRVDVVTGQPVPSLVYRRNGHMITVVAVPIASGEKRPPVAGTDAGYNILRWTAPGFRYWAVSDLDKPELAAFVEALRAD